MTDMTERKGNRPGSVQDVEAMLAREGYVADREIAIALYLSLTLEKPLLIEGPAGVGKTEIARCLASALQTRLIRLQCYEGLDAYTALYEWNYPKQLLRLQMDRNDLLSPEERERTIFSEEYLLERPLLAAIRQRDKSPVLLIDELDRADNEFDAFLLEILDDFQITIPELGTLRATHIPHVIITSNRTRELSDALRRRCLYLWIDYPSFQKELAIIRTRLPGISERLAQEVAEFVGRIRQLELDKLPGTAEALDWARALAALGCHRLDADSFSATLTAIAKTKNDRQVLQSALEDGRLQMEGSTLAGDS